jgi:uncharacterized protein (DUF4415 family)
LGRNFASGFSERGRQASQRAVLISLDRDVVDVFRSQGDDPLARIKAVLRAYVDERRQSGSRE